MKGQRFEVKKGCIRQTISAKFWQAMGIAIVIGYFRKKLMLVNQV